LKGKLLLLLIIAIIIALSYVYSLPPEPKLEISRIYNANLQPGQTIEVNITISDVVDLASYFIDLAWDPYVLKVTTGDKNGWQDPLTGIYYSVYEGPFLKKVSNSTRFLIAEVDNAKGKIVYLFGGYRITGIGATGSGVLVTINFTCVHPGTTTIEIVGPANGTAILHNSRGDLLSHTEVYGLITTEGPPPIWANLVFQTTVATVETIVLIIISVIIIILRRPPSKSKKKRMKEEELLEEEIFGEEEEF